MGGGGTRKKLIQAARHLSGHAADHRGPDEADDDAALFGLPAPRSSLNPDFILHFFA